MTAEELAAELAVSKRTIYRDIDALSVAGVPVYANGGPGGGYALLDSYRTTLTGLNENEIRALFMLTLQVPLSDLGVSQQLKTAILKLTSSFAEDHYEHTNYLRQRLRLDAASWFQTDELIPHLKIVQEAVWQDRQLILSYRRRNGAVSERTIDAFCPTPRFWAWRELSVETVSSKSAHITKSRRDTRPRSGVACSEGWAAPSFQWTDFKCCSKNFSVISATFGSLKLPCPSPMTV